MSEKTVATKAGALDIDRAKVEIPHPTRFWGQEYTCEPKFVEQVLGDGRALLGLSPLNTRPNYYVIRIDSTWHLYGCRVCKDECPDEVTEHLDEIYEAIEDEYGSAEQIRESNEEDPDEEPESDDWPVMSCDSGSSWFTLDPKEFLGKAEIAEVRP